MRVIIALSLLILIGCSDQPSTSHLNTTREFEIQKVIAEFEHQLAKDVEEDDIASISAAIVIDGKVVWSNAFGMADIENKINADTSTIYRISSMSKTFTAFLMMQLIEEGYFKLEDTVENYFPEIQQLIGYSDSTKITFKHLASHTSGLFVEPELKDANAGPIAEWEDKLLLAIPATSFQYKLGEKYSYCNIGYGILGLAISRAANKPFMELVQEKIFDPLKMNNSFFIVPDGDTMRLATGYDGGPMGEIKTEIPKKEHKGRGYKVPNGGIYSTSNDLGKFLIANMEFSDEPILSRENCELMQEIWTPKVDGWRNKYGLGYNIINHKGLMVCSHGGNNLGYSSMFMFEKNKKIGVIILRNYAWGMTWQVMRSWMLIKKLSEMDDLEKTAQHTD
ncbi:MAG: beta-lactamase family protein [Flavobacteriales bacterium]|nr:beta-lactamase family protein [Flavobacteriales bacterium]